jgi:hypothetical protein
MVLQHVITMISAVFLRLDHRYSTLFRDVSILLQDLDGIV